MKIIVNADDFGLSSNVNHAICDAFQKKIISSTTLLANMPGFDEAVKMIQAGQISKKSVGIHLNLFEGVPLTENMRKNLLYCDENGVYRYTSGHIPFFATKSIADTIVYDELEAQIKKILATGLIPSHLDSHSHYHSNWYVGKTVIALAKKYRIPYIRTSPNLSHQGLKRKLLNLFFNRKKRLEINQLKKCDYMGNISEVESFLEAQHYKDFSIEIMVHPVYSSDGILEDAEFHAPLVSLLSFLQNVILSSYSDDEFIFLG